MLWSHPPALRRPRGLTPNVLDVPAADASDAFRSTGLAVAPQRGGLGFRAVQAYRAGLSDRRVTVVPDPSLRPVPTTTHALVEAYAEWYALQHCDDVLDDSKSTPLVTVVVPHYNLGAYLPEALSSLAGQTYRALEVIVIDDGSTDPASRHVFERMQDCHPSFRFLAQDNQGIGATRNVGLRLGRGEFFLPFDADNVARPDMIATYVRAMQRCPDVAAFTCYFDAFAEHDDPARERWLYGCRPTGGPWVLSASQNVYGDACALFRRQTLLDAGGFEIDRGTSFEDWELFVKLVGRGLVVDVVPTVLFHYRHRGAGFSRSTDGDANRRRVLRQFAAADRLAAHERAWLGPALAGIDSGRRPGLAARMWQWLGGGR